MKKLIFLILICVFMATPVAADMLVVSVNPPTFTNPQGLPNSGEATETAWLAGLLGFSVPFISKDEDSNPLDNVPASWTYAVLKYGVGSLPNDHWAIWDSNNNNILELGGILDLPNIERLSHVSYFGPTQVPEPTTMILLGSGLLGLAIVGRKLWKK